MPYQQLGPTKSNLPTSFIPRIALEELLASYKQNDAVWREKALLLSDKLGKMQKHGVHFTRHEDKLFQRLIDCIEYYKG